MKKWFLLCLCLWFPCSAGAFESPLQKEAETLMARCEAVLWHEKQLIGAEIDEALDPDHTGLVGVEFSPLTTSMGYLADKRNSAAPAMAGAAAGYYLQAGLKEGDWIALNASGSFPGFTLAALCAAQVMKLNTVMVFSYGSSMYGGTVPEFTFPVMLDALNRTGLLSMKIDLIAPGGAYDRMDEILLEDGRPLVRQLMSQRSEPTMEEPDFAGAIRRRMELFLSRPVKVFVNSGGSWSSLGRSEEILKVGHGLLTDYAPIPKDADRGLIFDFLERGYPVVHLLYTRGICRDWNIPYIEMADPQ